MFWHPFPRSFLPGHLAKCKLSGSINDEGIFKVFYVLCQEVNHFAEPPQFSDVFRVLHFQYGVYFFESALWPSTDRIYPASFGAQLSLLTLRCMFVSLVFCLGELNGKMKFAFYVWAFINWLVSALVKGVESILFHQRVINPAGFGEGGGGGFRLKPHIEVRFKWMWLHIRIFQRPNFILREKSKEKFDTVSWKG